MPGLFGVAGGPPDESARLFEAGLASLRAYPWHSAASWADGEGGVSVGRAVPSGIPTADVPFVHDEGPLAVAVDGEVYGTGDDRSSPATLLWRLLQTGRVDSLAGISGSFNAAIWDRRTRTVTLVNDRFATRPLYWCLHRGRFIFGAEVKALFADPAVPRTLSPAGVGQFFTFGQFLGTRTLYEAVEALAPATALTLHTGTGRVEARTYAPRRDAPPAVGGDGWIDGVADRLLAAVASRTAGAAGLGLSLSGGLDARTLLALIDPAVELTTVSLGIPGSIDHRSAARLSALSGRRHHALHLDRQFLGRFREHLLEMVRLTDGQYLDQGIVMTTLPHYRELGIRTLVRGHAGELMHMDKAYAYSLDHGVLAATSREEVFTWLAAHLSDYMVGGLEGSPFAPAFADAPQRARESLRSAADGIDAGEPPVQLVWPLFVEQRLARETSLSMHKFRSFVEVRLPYLDERLVPWLLAGQPELKLGDRLQSAVLRRYQPSFLNVVNSNTGAPLGAGPLRTRAAWLRMKVYAKLGVPGYQPYERLGLWLAQDLRPLVHDLLLGDRFAARGVFLPEAVRTVVEAHESRRKNHTFLLMAMMIFELGQRLLVDEAA